MALRRWWWRSVRAERPLLPAEGGGVNSLIGAVGWSFVAPKFGSEDGASQVRWAGRRGRRLSRGWGAWADVRRISSGRLSVLGLAEHGNLAGCQLLLAAIERKRTDVRQRSGT